MFKSEAQGLILLRGSNALVVPEVIHAGTAGSHQFLLLEYLEGGRRQTNFWVDFGSGLAKLHRMSADAFGLDHDNYIGSLPQSNSPSLSWVEFFIGQRLRIQLQIAVEHNRIGEEFVKKFDTLFDKLPSILPEEPPSLLHGDLWGGNLMISKAGRPGIIDPAVYYGHREVDLAMTKLFGGFDASYIDSYDEAYPLMPGYQERMTIYNLYPLLVHLNLFGGAYKAQVVEVVRRFV